MNKEKFTRAARLSTIFSVQTPLLYFTCSSHWEWDIHKMCEKICDKMCSEAAQQDLMQTLLKRFEPLKNLLMPRSFSVVKSLPSSSKTHKTNKLQSFENLGKHNLTFLLHSKLCMILLSMFFFRVLRPCVQSNFASKCLQGYTVKLCP